MNSYQPLNDYEIIALMQEGHDECFKIMVDKYSRFISKKIHKFNLAYMYDDLYQEGLIILHKSLLAFNPSFNKTFTRYFEQNLERYLISTIRTLKSRKHMQVIHYQEIKENNHRVHENSAYYYAYLKDMRNILTELEYRVYILREVKNCAVDMISKSLNVSTKVVYNSLHRAKAKIRVHFKD